MNLGSLENHSTASSTNIKRTSTSACLHGGGGGGLDSEWWWGAHYFLLYALYFLQVVRQRAYSTYIVANVNAILRG